MRSRGFSLLEVLVAVTIIGVGFAAVFAALSGSLRGLARVDASDNRLELARLKLAELDLIKLIRPGDAASGKFEDGTSWKLESFPFIAPIESGPRPNRGSVIRIDLTLEWAGRNGIQKKVIQTYRYMPYYPATIASLEQQLHDLQ